MNIRIIATVAALALAGIAGTNSAHAFSLDGIGQGLPGDLLKSNALPPQVNQVLQKYTGSQAQGAGQARPNLAAPRRKGRR